LQRSQGYGVVQRDTPYLAQLSSLLEAALAAVEKAPAAVVSYADLSSKVDLGKYEREFTGGDPLRTYAWQSYYLGPGLMSAWTSLGYLVPEED